MWSAKEAAAAWWRRWMACACLGLASLGSGRAASDAVPGEVLVKWRERRPEARQLQGARDGRLPAGARVKQVSPDGAWELIQLPHDRSDREGLAHFRARRDVAAVEPNHRWHLLAVPNDPQWPRLYGLDAIRAHDAWNTTVGDTNVVAAIIDTGIDVTHPDLVPNLWRNPGEVPGNGRDDDGNGIVDDVHGADFLEGDGNPMDDSGHGTHVAGTIGATGDNATGGVGVCWKVRLLGVRVGGVDGFTDTFQLAQAFDYLVRLKRRGVDIRAANCSWAGGFPSAFLKEAIEVAGAAGILIVCAAGNDRQDNDALPSYPSGYDVPEIITVGASEACDDPSVFSNYGARTVHLAAPGTGILSTYPGGKDGRHAYLSGTSMAAPHVTGAAALLASRRRNLTVAQTKQILLATTDPVPGWAGRSVTGGRLDVARAIEAADRLVLPTAPEPPARSGRVALVSGARAGRWGNGNSSEPAMTPDGRWIAFTSIATNLVAGDREDFVDVFLRDTVAGTTTRVTQTATGTGGNGDSVSPAISADGRFVAFATDANNLAAGDANNATDVVVWDRETRQFELSSQRTDGRGSGNGDSDSPAISADGSVVAFASDASNLVANDRNGVRDVFVRLRGPRSTERVSVTALGAEATGIGDAPSISGDGRIVVFHSDATNLVTGDLNGAWDVFVRDRDRLTTEIVSAAGTPPIPGNADSVFPVVSADGRHVAFGSAASNLDGRNSGGHLALFVVDRTARALTRVSGPAAPHVPRGNAYVDGLSSDGRFVSFSSDDPGLAPGGAPDLFRAFFWDRWVGEAELVSVSDAGYSPEESAFYGRPGNDGRWLAYAALGFNLVSGDGNGAYDVFLLDRGRLRPDLSVRAGDQGAVAGRGTVHPRRPQRAGGRVSGTTPVTYEVRLTNLGEGAAFVLRASVSGGAGWQWAVQEDGTGPDLGGVMAGAGGWRTRFLAPGSNLVLRASIARTAATGGEATHALWIEAREAVDGPALDVVDLVTDADLPPPGLQLASRAWDGVPSARNAEVPAISADGRFVVFSSEADHMVAGGDTNFQSDVFLVDRADGRIRRVSDASATDQANADSRYPTLSADGRRVAFQSRATNLVPRDSNDVEDIFVRDLVDGSVVRASTSATGAQANHASEGAFLSAGGRHVVFTSFASNLVPGDANGVQDVFVRDLESGFVECVSRTSSGVFGDADSEGGQLSADGRFVLFNSYAGNLDPRDRNGFADVYLYDRLGGLLELISLGTNGVAGNGPSGATSLSADGRYVTFFSYASDLAPGATFTQSRGYLLDRQTRELTPLSRWVTGLPPGLEARRALVTPDGRGLWVAVGAGCEASERSSQVLAIDLPTRRVLPVSVLRDGTWGDDHSFLGRPGGGGRHLALETHADRLIVEPHRPSAQVMVADLLVPEVRGSERRLPDGPWRDEDDGGSSRDLPELVQLAEPGGNAAREFVVRLANAAVLAQSLRVRGTPTPASGTRIEIRLGNAAGPVLTEAVFSASGWRSDEVPRDGELVLHVRLGLPDAGLVDPTLVLEAGPDADPARRRAFRLTTRADTDGDGLADSWERRWWGTLNRADAATDADQDGLPDAGEQWAGTSPLDATDAPRLGPLRRLPDGAWSVGWRTADDVYYAVEGADDAAGPFATLGPPQRAPGGATELSMTLPSSGARESAVVRLRVEPP